MKDGEISYMKLENAREVEKLEIPEEEGGFDFFHGLGIIGYKKSFKMWLRKFPRPILILALDKMEVLGWIYMEEWGETSIEGMPVHVLRAIEVLPEFRNRGIGGTLVVLSLKEISGYVITKPLTGQADKFFRRMGFLGPEEFKKEPVDLSKHPKYLILPIYERDVLVKDFENHTSGSKRT